MTKDRYIEEHGEHDNFMLNDTFPEICPVCGVVWETVYIDKFGDIAGCDSCVKVVDWYDV